MLHYHKFFVGFIDCFLGPHHSFFLPLGDPGRSAAWAERNPSHVTARTPEPGDRTVTMVTRRRSAGNFKL